MNISSVGPQFGNASPDAPKRSRFTRAAITTGKYAAAIAGVGAASYAAGAGAVGISNLAGAHWGDNNTIHTIFPFANQTGPVETAATTPPGDAVGGGTPDPDANLSWFEKMYKAVKPPTVTLESGPAAPPVPAPKGGTP